MSMSSRFSTDCPSILHVPPALEGATERPFVSILQVTTHRQTTRQARHAQTQGSQFPFNIVRGVFSLEVRIRGKDHLSYIARAHPLQQLVNTQILWSNAL